MGGRAIMSMRVFGGYPSIAEYARVHGLQRNTVMNQLAKGYCQWPRTTHDGRRQHPLKIKYEHIKARCYDKATWNYCNYGGRGISMCATWYVDFWAFVRDIEALGPQPEGYTLDRIDNNGHYEPGNVRWASKLEQVVNRRVRKDSGSVPGLSWRATYNHWQYTWTDDITRRRHTKCFKDYEKALTFIKETGNGYFKRVNVN